ncbi:uncharacterized protein LOC127291243 [Leptopilina boulardi]|uniref:uncharacterized protein LOC127291243 n=1 Tax=Leptopilina boulardi TaxID=63433 RepID=UPI0021F5C8D1|nr:uncharacterized protein LOC127291243 [Leptopilina boulardi]
MLGSIVRRSVRGLHPVRPYTTVTGSKNINGTLNAKFILFEDSGHRPVFETLYGYPDNCQYYHYAKENGWVQRLMSYDWSLVPNDGRERVSGCLLVYQTNLGTYHQLEYRWIHGAP